MKKNKKIKRKEISVLYFCIFGFTYLNSTINNQTIKQSNNQTIKQNIYLKNYLKFYVSILCLETAN